MVVVGVSPEGAVPLAVVWMFREQTPDSFVAIDDLRPGSGSGASPAGKELSLAPVRSSRQASLCSGSCGSLGLF